MNEYNLKASLDGIGRLSKILLDKFGNVIDGKHRQELDPDCPTETLEFIDTPQKLAMARLAINFCRRVVEPDEIVDCLVELMGKHNMSIEQVETITGISKTTIYKYMPKERKNQERSEATKQGIAEHRPPLAEVSSKTSDMPPVVMVECERCHTATSEPKEWHGHQLCEIHYKGAQLDPEFYERFFGYLDKAKKGEVPPETKAKPLEKWSDREAKMHPLHSKMEENVLALLIGKGVRNIVQDRHFCVRETVPDYFFPEKKLAVYLDFTETHRNRQDKDEQLRDWLTKCHGVRVLSLPYDTVSQKETDRLVHAIIEETSA